MHDNIIQILTKRKDEISSWLAGKEDLASLPLYSSVDIRNSGTKISVIDTNLFPAGFNNICRHDWPLTQQAFKEAILRRVPDCQNVLIIAEEHTRNTWYLENVLTLQQMITSAGFNAKVATFFKITSGLCEKANYVELETATGQALKVFCLYRIVAD